MEQLMNERLFKAIVPIVIVPLVVVRHTNESSLAPLLRTSPHADWLSVRCDENPYLVGSKIERPIFQTKYLRPLLQ